MNAVIPTRFHSPHLAQLIETLLPVTRVTLVHTEPGHAPVRGCKNIIDTRRNISEWWLTGIGGRNAPTLLLNDDIQGTVEAFTAMLDALETADLVTLPKDGGTTPLTGWCFGIRPNTLRPDPRFGWFYTEDTIWRDAEARGLRVATVDVDVIHERANKPVIPAEFRAQVKQDRTLYLSMWGSK